MLLGGWVPLARAQGSVLGTVTDRSGGPLGGAQVSVQGQQRPAVSDGRGQFVIRGLPAGNYTLEVRRIGFRMQTSPVVVPASGTVTVAFHLDVSAVTLDEVVVTGTGGGVERRKLGQSIASVDASDLLEGNPTGSLGALLQAQVPGLRSVGTSGGSGASRDFRIRGTSSFLLGQRPVVYVDGVRVDTRQAQFVGGGMNSSMGTACCAVDGGAGSDRLDDLNPDEIDHVEVLKGPAAATLYGSEASNGVVQIFTKRGRQSSATRWSLEYGSGFNRLRRNLGTRLYPRFTSTDTKTHETIVGKDANQLLIQSGLHQNVNISAQGGGEALTYFVSGGYLYDQGSIQPNDEKRGDLRLNLSWTASDKWSFDVNSMYVHNGTTLLQSGNNWTALLGNALLGNPQTATSDRPFGEPWVAIRDIQKLNAKSTVDRWTGGVTARWAPARNFTHRLTLGLDAVSDETTKFFPFGSFYVYVNTVGERDLGYRNFKSFTFDYLGQVNFKLPWGIGSDFSYGTQGFWQQERRNMAIGKTYAGPGVYTVSGGAQTLGAELYSKTVNIGVFAQNRFSIADKLFVTGGFRADGNSAFGRDYGFQFYPKADAAYVLSHEGFLPGFVSSLKLRGAIGMSGNTPGAFDQFRTFQPQAVLDDQTGVYPDAPGNNKLAPERTLEVEGGTDLGLFQDRLGLGLTYYHRRTNNALLGVPLPPSEGFVQAQLQNIGRLQDKGWELSLNAAIVNGKSLRWSSTVTMSDDHGKILDLGPAAVCGPPASDGKKYCKLGGFRTNYPVGALFGQTIVGDTALTSGPTASNLWGRNFVRSDTAVYRGDPLPHWTGSVGNTLQFRAFTLFSLLSWEKGAVFSNGDRPYAVRFHTGDEYLSTFDFSQSQPVRTAASDSLFNYWNLVNAFDSRDNLRLQEISLSWELPRGLIGRLGLGRTTITAAGQNVWWWDHCHCRDPNGTWQGGADFGFNSDFLSTPQPRRFVATVRTVF
jgi:TonB-dependent SusC/RagA subfamily outer membrane receptor